MDALEVLENIQKLNVTEAASQTVADSVELIADLNATQLSQGRRSDGSETKPDYTDFTIEQKSQKSGLSGVFDRVTLYDTGAFYRGLYATVQGEDVTIGSTDPKEPSLEKKYSTQKGSIFGLNEDSKEELITGHLQSKWENKVAEITGLEFE